MTNLSRIIAGKKAKKAGDRFEDVLHINALRSGWEVIKIPMGAKMLTKHKMVRVATPFDFVFAKNKDKIIFCDAKTTTGMAFSNSQVKEHQMDKLFALHNKGFKSGYIICFVKKDITCFFSADKLHDASKVRGSLKPEDGIRLGDCTKINLDLLFEI